MNPTLNIFPQSVLDSLVSKEYRDERGVLRKDGRKDAPGAMLAWALAGRFTQQPERWQPWMGGITDNHKIQAAAAWIEATEAKEERYTNWWFEMLDEWETEGECGGEQCPSGYDGHHISSLVTVAVRALISGNDKLYERTVAAINRWVSLRLSHQCPANSHKDVRLTSFIAGRRCVDIGGKVTGSTIHRDVPLLSLTRVDIPRDWKWPINQGTYVEDHIVYGLRNRLPDFSKLPREYPKLIDSLHFIRFENGHVSWTPVSTMKTGRGGCILWLIKVNYRTGHTEEISWRDPLNLPYKEEEARATGNKKRPYARQMGGGLMPGNFPNTSDIGHQMGDYLIFGTRVGQPIVNNGAPVSSPLPDSPTPPPVPPPARPVPDRSPLPTPPSADRLSVPEKGMHVKLPQKGRQAIINIKLDNSGHSGTWEHVIDPASGEYRWSK